MSGPKLKFILSDLHLGAGFAGDGGNRLEDFTADEEFVRLLQHILHESEQDQREIELIINGDFFEFLQVPATDDYRPGTIYPPEAYLDSSEPASIRRLSLITRGHRQVFNALSDFMHASQPQRRITIIKGNHDVHLFWPRVKSHLREILGASGTRSSLLLFAEEFVSREKIYVAHGHQFAEKMNSYHDHLDPRLSANPNQLFYPAGSHFVVSFFNQIEHTHWFVDSIKPLTALIWYALPWNFDFAAGMLASFIRHTPALVVSNFSPENGATLPPDTLLQSLEDAAERQKLAQQYANNPDFRLQFHRQIQQYLDDAGIAYKSATMPAEFEVDSDPLVMGRAEQTRQQNALRQAAEEMSRREGAKVVLFGHSHRPVCEQLPNGSLYINTGSWLGAQDLNNAPPEIWKALLTGNPSPASAAVCLPYARIEYDGHGNPSARLLDFANQNNPLQTPSSGPAPAWLTRLFGRITASFGAGQTRR